MYQIKYNVNTKSIPVAKKIIISGEALAKYRQKAGLTQKELAEGEGGLGITRVTLAGWEKQISIEIDEKQANSIKTLLGVDVDVLTNVPRGAYEQDILDHPVIKSLVDQSKYILKRVSDLERENEDLKNRLGGSGV